MDPFPFEVQRQTGGYWRSVGLCLLLSLLGIGYSFPRLTAQYRVTSSQLNGMMSGPVWQGNAGGGYTSGNEEYLLQALAPFAGVVIIVMLIAAAIGLCWAAFLINPLTVGRNRYFMESRQSATPFSTVTSIFRTPYLNVVKVMLLTNLKIALGSLLIIPGIYWSYCYMQVGYLMAENPFLTTCRALADENRIRILMALRGRQLCVCQVTAFLDLAPSTTSKHLSILRQGRLIESNKQGRWVYYRLADDSPRPNIREALAWMKDSLANDPTIIEDEARIAEILRAEEACGFGHGESDCFHSLEVHSLAQRFENAPQEEEKHD